MTNKPVFFSDSITDDDKFRRKPLAKDIAEMLLNSFDNGHDSITVGIEGEWGSGKSNFLHFLSEELKKKENQTKGNSEIILIHFNPWIFTDHESLLTGLLNKMYSKIGGLNADLKKGFQSLVKFFESSKLSEIKTGLIKTDAGIKAFKAALNFLAKHDLEQLKNDINRELQTKNYRLFIQIDDLDRLLPFQLMEMFKVIRLFSDFKNTVFIVAYDKKVITKILNDEFKYDGHNYLEKIIQFEFNLPAPLHEDIYAVYLETFRSLFNRVGIENDEKMLERLWYEGLNGVLKNARSIYRLSNSLHLPLMKLKNQVVIKQLIALETIRLFDINTYKSLYNLSHISNRFSKEQTSIESLTESHSTRKLWKVLNENSNPSDSISYISNLNFSNPKIKYRYFSYMLESSEIDSEIIMQLLSLNSDALEIFKTQYKEGKFSNLLSRLIGYRWVTIGDDRKKYIVEDLYKFLFANQHNYNEDMTETYELASKIVESSKDKKRFTHWFSQLTLNGFFSGAAIHHLSWLYHDLKEKNLFNLENRQEYIDKIEAFIKNTIKEWKYLFFPIVTKDSVSKYGARVFYSWYARLDKVGYETDVLSITDVDTLIIVMRNATLSPQEDGSSTRLTEDYDKYISSEIELHILSVFKTVSFKNFSTDYKSILLSILNFLHTKKVISIEEYSAIEES